MLTFQCNFCRICNYFDMVLGSLKNGNLKALSNYFNVNIMIRLFLANSNAAVHCQRLLIHDLNNVQIFVKSTGVVKMFGCNYSSR